MIGRCRRALASTLSALLLSAGLPTAALAQPAPVEDARTEARTRYERAVERFNDGDNAGALAEFKRAYELVPNPVALYNIGLVYAAMGRPVEAVETLDRVLQNPGALSPEELTRAHQTRDTQAQRIAELSVTTSTPARVEIDGIDAGQTPLSAPIRIASGVHVVGAVAEGYAPAHREVTIASGQKAEVSLDLVAMQGKLAHLTVTTHLPAADLVIDGQVVGKTPLPQSISVTPGHHVVAVRRTGYLQAQEDMTLDDGAQVVVNIEPAVDVAALGTSGGFLALDASEPDPVVTVDGVPHGIYTASIELPQGVHRLLVQRGGFEPVERDVTVPAGATIPVHVLLDPTPDTRASYVSHTTAQRAWGIAAVIGGAAIVGGAVGFIVWNAGQKNDAQRAFDLATANFVNKVGVCSMGTVQSDATACNNAQTSARSDLSDANTRATLGYILGGVGIATAGLGVVLLVTNGDPHRYDHLKASNVGLTWSPTGWADARGGGGVGIAGAF